MTIKQKIKNAAKKVARTGLAAIVLVTPLSCATNSGGSYSRGVSGAMLQTSPNSTPSDRSLGAGASTMGDMLHRSGTARAGRSQVNISNNVVQGNDGNLYPAPGYIWVNPTIQGDYRIKKITVLFEEGKADAKDVLDASGFDPNQKIRKR